MLHAERQNWSEKKKWEEGLWRGAGRGERGGGETLRMMEAECGTGATKERNDKLKKHSYLFLCRLIDSGIKAKKI